MLRIASTRGLHSATMREVAAEAGVSVRLVQYYFHTKEQLLLAALAYLTEQLTERVSASIRALGPVTPRSIVHGTLTAVLPTDAEGVRLTRGARLRRSAEGPRGSAQPVVRPRTAAAVRRPPSKDGNVRELPSGHCGLPIRR